MTTMSNANSLTRAGGANAARGYRFDHFRAGLMLRDMRFSRKALRPGDLFPRVDLLTTDGSRFQLDEYAAGRPILFVTGSITCPLTAASISPLKKLQEKYGDRIAFVLLYVREGHPGELYSQPHAIEDKLHHARDLQRTFDISWPVAVDNIEGSLHQALDAKPNSLHLVDSNGRVIFRALWAEDTSSIEQAVEELARGKALTKSESQRMLGPVLRAGGYITEVLRTGGRTAVRDVWLAAPPMILLGHLASLFTFASKSRRGPLAAALLAATAVATAAAIVFGV